MAVDVLECVGGKLECLVDVGAADGDDDCGGGGGGVRDENEVSNFDGHLVVP